MIQADTFTAPGRRRPPSSRPSIRLLATPGHSPQDITTLVGTADEVAA